jgi:hypothetical protein
MRWERLFADLEARMEAEERAAAEGEVTDLVRAERARLAVRDRLQFHLGEVLTWSFVSGGQAMTGRLLDLGADWALVATERREVLIPLGAVQYISGLTRFTAPEAGVVARRLGIGVVLRGLSRDRALVRVLLLGDQAVIGTIDRVGADHFDVAMHPDDEPRRERAVLEVRCVLFPAVMWIAVS